MSTQKMNVLYRVGVGVCMALAALAGMNQPARAQATAQAASKAEAPIEVKLTQWRVVVDGKKAETFADANSVKPGDVIEYRSTYRNVSPKTVKALVAVLPFPEGLDYVADSSKPTVPAAEAATKDGQYAAQPLLRTVKDKDGKTKTEHIPYSEYRSLRWRVGDLLPGKSIEIKARARVESSETGLAPQAVQAPVGVSALRAAASATQP